MAIRRKAHINMLHVLCIMYTYVRAHTIATQPCRSQHLATSFIAQKVYCAEVTNWTLGTVRFALGVVPVGLRIVLICVGQVAGRPGRFPGRSRNVELI